MRKHDLKPGMKVVLRDGKVFQVVSPRVIGCDDSSYPLLWGESGFVSLKLYNEKLKRIDNYSKYDIIMAGEDSENSKNYKFKLLKEDEGDNNMKKKDLKTGMRVELKSGEVYMVITDINSSYYGYQEKALIDNHGFVPLSKYSEDMRYSDKVYGNSCVGESDIEKVYSNCPFGNTTLSADLLDLSVKTLIWERKDFPIVGDDYYIPCLGNETLFEAIVWRDTVDNIRIKDTIGVFERPALAIERSKEILERWDDF